MYRVKFTEEQLEALRELRKEPLKPAERDRVEMLLLHATGMTTPQLAEHFGRHPERVRLFLHTFEQQGLDAIYVHRPGPPPDEKRRREVERELRAAMRQTRTWSSPQLADVLERRGLPLSERQIRRYLRGMGARYGRTKSTLRHLQDPEEKAEAEAELRALESLAQAQMLRLFYFDESAFSPSQPTGRGWFLPGQSRLVPYESPQGRRVIALAAFEPFGRPAELFSRLLGANITCHDVVETLRFLPHSPEEPAVAVLDNAPVHHARACEAERWQLATEGLRLKFLPPYSPELNRIEGEFRIVKYDKMPRRTYSRRGSLPAAVRRAFKRRAEEHRQRCRH